MAVVTHRDPRFAFAGDTDEAQGLKVGDKVWLADGGKRPWTVRARNDRYVILTKPFNLQRTTQYTVIDLELGIRGTDNYGGLGYENEEDIADAMARFDSGDAEISRRNNVTLLLDRIESAVA